MSCTRTQLLDQARSWIGRKESNGSHKEIIDVYNSHKPRARGYKLKYTDAWCSGFVSACAIACGATDIIPTEVGVGKHITLFKNLGIWVEADDYVPLPGDIIVYYWKDSGKGELKTGASHIGYVEKVEDLKITVIEGNYSNSVKRREIAVNGRYIRGFATPKYDEVPEPEPVPVPDPVTEVTITLPVLTQGMKGDRVKPVQRMLLCLGYDLGSKPVDGSYGPKTLRAVLKYQEKNGLPTTGQVDEQTWRKFLGLPDPE